MCHKYHKTEFKFHTVAGHVLGYSSMVTKLRKVELISQLCQFTLYYSAIKSVAYTRYVILSCILKLNWSTQNVWQMKVYTHTRMFRFD